MVKFTLIALLAGLLMPNFLSAAEPLPPASELPRSVDFPEALKMRDGTPVKTQHQWLQERRPELKRLFQHYMYGYFPAAPKSIVATVDYKNEKAFGGKATLTCLTLKFGPPAAPAMHVLLVVPNERKAPAPVFVGLNFTGNYTLADDPKVPLATGWMPSWCKGQVKNQAVDKGRGIEKQTWCLEQTIDRGYAVATVYYGDIDPDKPGNEADFNDGVHPHFAAPVEQTGTAPGSQRGPHDWGAIAAWAWGVQRIVDYVVTDSNLDKSRIAVVGHSRLGKTALLAGAFDERIGLVIPHQAGCGGTAPSRHKIGESVKRINQAFPHWFCGEFKKFGDDVERLPFDQHCLVALCAPRPVLFTNAVLDTWADPTGQFRTLQGADPVYHFLGTDGLPQQNFPELGKLVNGRLGYYIREGQHSMTSTDWTVFCDFADKQFAAKK